MDNNFTFIGYLDGTVQGLINLLSQLPADATISPFGSPECAVGYDPVENAAYLDEAGFLEEEFGIDEDDNF